MAGTYDFDYIVIGSGFGGSVAAHRLTEKGYRVGVMEMGRRWTRGESAHHQLADLAVDLAARLGLRGFFNIEPFRHVVIMHGCAVGGGSITYANTLLVPPRPIWDSGSWAGLADWKSGDAGRITRPRAHAGSRREPHHRSGGPTSCSARPKPTASGAPFIAPGLPCFEGAGRRSPGAHLSRPVFRRRRAGARHLHRLRRLHDGLPLQRQEYARQELSLPGREARRAGFRGNQGGGCPAAERQRGRKPGLRGAHRPLDGLGPAPAAPLHLPRRGLRRLGAGHPGPAVSAEAERVAARGSAINSATACAPMPNR